MGSHCKRKGAAPPELRWEEIALETIKQISPKAFETLCQRFLRESGFIQVEITGRSGEGGIDGRGVGILSFHVIFHCKRYKNTVSASVVRDFRGAMVGRADKGLLITTATFTRMREQKLNGMVLHPPDLIDGEELVQKLKDWRLGIESTPRVIKNVNVNKDWLNNL